MIRKLHGKTQARLRVIAERYSETRTSIPVDLSVMTKVVQEYMRCKITMLSSHDGPKGLVSGSGVKNELSCRIRLRNNLTFLDHRFTWAHELGHIVAEPEYGMGIILQKGYLRKQERVADAIAGYLLCPWNDLEDFLWNEFPCLWFQRELFYPQANKDLLKLKEVARIFQVTFLVLYRQIRELFWDAYLKIERVDQALSIVSNSVFDDPKFKRL
jgi:hypothetical protein